MSTDSRTTYTIPSDSDKTLISISETGLITVSGPYIHKQIINIEVSFPNFAAAKHLSTSIGVNVIHLDYISLDSMIKIMWIRITCRKYIVRMCIKELEVLFLFSGSNFI